MRIIMTDIFASMTFIQLDENNFCVKYDFHYLGNKRGSFNGNIDDCLNFWDRHETTDADLAYHLRLKDVFEPKIKKVA